MVGKEGSWGSRKRNPEPMELCYKIILKMKKKSFEMNGAFIFNSISLFYLGTSI